MNRLKVFFALLIPLLAGCGASEPNSTIARKIDAIVSDPLVPVSLLFEGSGPPSTITRIRLNGSDDNGNSDPIFPITVARTVPQQPLDIPVATTRLTVQCLDVNSTIAAQAVLSVHLRPDTPVTLTVPYLPLQTPVVIASGRAQPVALSADGTIVAAQIRDEMNVLADYQLINSASSSLLNVDGVARAPSQLEGILPRISADGSVAVFGYALDGNADRLAIYETGKTSTFDPLKIGEDDRGSYGQAALSPNGRFIAYKARTPLPDGSYSGDYDIFFYDRQTASNRQLTTFSQDFGTEPLNGNDPLGVAADGSFVIIKTPLNDTDGADALYKVDTQTLLQTLIPVEAETFNESLAGNGAFLAFENEATNQAVWMNLASSEQTAVSAAEAQSMALAPGSSISSDGRFVVLLSPVPLVLDGMAGIYVKDTQQNIVQQVGLQGFSAAGSPLISGDGRSIVFALQDSELNAVGIGRVANPLIP